MISYVVGLKKRLAELEGVSEDNLSVPQVDVSNILNGTTNSGGNTTVLGNPAVPATATATSGAADGMHVGMVGGMQGQPMAVQGPVMTGMPLQEGVQQDDPAKAGMPARGMPAPALNANQVCSSSSPQLRCTATTSLTSTSALLIPEHRAIFTDNAFYRYWFLLL